jgi:hypothetical protein
MFLLADAGDVLRHQDGGWNAPLTLRISPDGNGVSVPYSAHLLTYEIPIHPSSLGLCGNVLVSI